MFSERLRAARLVHRQWRQSVGAVDDGRIGRGYEVTR